MAGKSKFLAFALGLGLSSMLSPAALAQGPGGTAGGATLPAGLKIGIVNMQEAIYATNEGKKAFDALQARFGPKNNSLKILGDEVDNMRNDLQAKVDKLNEEDRANQVKAITDKQRAWQRNAEDFQNEVQQAQQEVINRIGPKMINVLEKYAKKNGYELIMDVSNPQTAVLWASQGMNITRELVDAYNAGAPVAAARTSKPAGPPASRPPASGATIPKKQ
jgi:outer membrane protein